MSDNGRDDFNQVIRAIIGWMLLSYGLMSIASGAIYVTTQGPESPWWSRIIAGVIILGLWYAGSREGR